MPDVLGTRAARLPPLPAGEPGAGEARLHGRHILGDGSVEPHSATEERLLAGLRPGAGGDLFGDAKSRLGEAYRRRARRIAARLSDRVRPGRTPRAVLSYAAL